MSLKYFQAILFISILYIPFNNTYADENEKYVWIASGGLPFFSNSSTVSINETDGNRGWGITYSAFNEDDTFSSTIDNKTGSKINPIIKEISVSKLFHFPSQYSKKTLSIGLAYAEGIKSDSCVSDHTSSTTTTRHCNITQYSGIAIPLQADITWGRYLGFGLFIRYLATVKTPYLMGGITLNFGKFHQI